MMKGITPRSRVIYECRSWSCRANSKFTSCTQLSLIYRINNETSTNSSSFRAIFQQAQVRTTLPLGPRVLREEYEMSTFMMNCFASLNDDWRCKWKIGRLVFLNTRRHSGNICQLVCLLWKTGSRKHEWGSLGGHRIELIDAAMTRKEQERRQGTVQEPVSVEWWWPRRRFNKMGSIIRLLANQSAANPRRKVLKHR